MAKKNLGRSSLENGEGLTAGNKKTLKKLKGHLSAKRVKEAENYIAVTLDRIYKELEGKGEILTADLKQELYEKTLKEYKRGGALVEHLKAGGAKYKKAYKVLKEAATPRSGVSVKDAVEDLEPEPKPSKPMARPAKSKVATADIEDVRAEVHRKIDTQKSILDRKDKALISDTEMARYRRRIDGLSNSELRKLGAGGAEVVRADLEGLVKGQRAIQERSTASLIKKAKPSKQPAIKVLAPGEVPKTRKVIAKPSRDALQEMSLAEFLGETPGEPQAVRPKKWDPIKPPVQGPAAKPPGYAPKAPLNLNPGGESLEQIAGVGTGTTVGGAGGSAGPGTPNPAASAASASADIPVEDLTGGTPKAPGIPDVPRKEAIPRTAIEKRIIRDISKMKDPQFAAHMKNLLRDIESTYGIEKVEELKRLPMSFWRKEGILKTLRTVGSAPGDPQVIRALRWATEKTSMTAGALMEFFNMHPTAAKLKEFGFKHKNVVILPEELNQTVANLTGEAIEAGEYKRAGTPAGVKGTAAEKYTTLEPGGKFAAPTSAAEKSLAGKGIRGFSKLGKVGRAVLQVGPIVDAAFLGHQFLDNLGERERAEKIRAAGITSQGQSASSIEQLKASIDAEEALKSRRHALATYEPDLLSNMAAILKGGGSPGNLTSSEMAIGRGSSRQTGKGNDDKTVEALINHVLRQLG